MNIGELAKFRGGIATDTISELTSASGVTIDSVLCKDGSVTGAASGTFTTTYVKAADTRGLALVNSSGTSVVTVSNAGSADVLKGIRVQGADAPSSGAGVEIDYGSVAAATGRLLCYDRTGAVRKAFVLDVLSTDFYAGGSSIGGYSSTGAWTFAAVSNKTSIGNASSTNNRVGFCGGSSAVKSFTLTANQKVTITIESGAPSSWLVFLGLNTTAGYGAIYAVDYSSATCVELADTQSRISNTNSPGSSAGIFGIYKSANSYTFTICKSSASESIDCYAYVMGAAIASVTDPAAGP